MADQASIYPFFRRLLFQLDPEQAHRLTLDLMRLAGKLPFLQYWLRAMFAAPSQPVQAFGLTFSNPVGLAAGYDKDGLGWQGLACLGFGHIEIGTVTPLPQPGNPRPRLFRLVEDGGLINRLGFPSQGAQFVTQRLRGRRPPGLTLGINLGKNKDTPLGEAVKDYLQLFDLFAPLADYLAVNVSSPNTEGLRSLQAGLALHGLLSPLVDAKRAFLSRWNESQPKALPLLVKLSPDLDESQLDEALDVLLEVRVDGVIASNTTIDHRSTASPLAGETGGLSGLPLRERTLQVIRYIHARTQGSLPIIGVGGVDSPESARQMLEAGASLVQVYTGLVYQGPGLVSQILRGLGDHS